MDAMDLPNFNFLAHELYQQLVSLDGLLTGVQTPTTHTLTPATTLSAIIDLEQSDESYHNEAGFVPPVISAQQASTYLNMVDTKSWQGGSATVTTLPTAPSARPSVVTTTTLTANMPSALPTSLPTAVVAPTPASATATTPARRNVGGRRPIKAKGISPEEEERRQVRRERNKAAAARCRKRRMDHTNALIKETEGLEQKKQGLQSEIQELNEQLEELNYILEAHLATGTCRHTTGLGVPRPESPPDIKPIVVLSPEALRIKQEAHIPAPTPNFVFEQPPPAKRPMLAMTTAAPIAVAPPAPVSVIAPSTPTISLSVTKPLRPTSLPVPPHIILKTNTTASEVAGIPISTPSTGIPFNFDSLMEGGTGLTPVSGPLVPSCSSQQRNQNSVDLASPDASIGNKLVSL